MVTAEKKPDLGSMERRWERGKEERITQSSFYLTFVLLVADLPWSLPASCSFLLSLNPAYASGQRSEHKWLQEGRNTGNNKNNICNNHVLLFFISTFSAPSAALPSGITGVKNQHFKTASRLLFKVPEIPSDPVNKVCCAGTPPGHGTATPVGTNLRGALHKPGLGKNWNKTSTLPSPHRHYPCSLLSHSSAHSSLAMPIQGSQLPKLQKILSPEQKSSCRRLRQQRKSWAEFGIRPKLHKQASRLRQNSVCGVWILQVSLCGTQRILSSPVPVPGCGMDLREVLLSKMCYNHPSPPPQYFYAAPKMP